MKNIRFPIVGLLLIIAACSAVEPPNTAQERLYHLVADRPVICEKGPDCKKKWARAVAFVHDRTVVLMNGRETNYQPSKLSANVIEGKLPEGKLRIMKLPMEDGRYKLDFYFECHNLGKRGEGFNNERCYQKVSRPMKMQFVNDMIGLPPGVTQTSPISYHVEAGVLPPEPPAE